MAYRFVGVIAELAHPHRGSIGVGAFFQIHPVLADVGRQSGDAIVVGDAVHIFALHRHSFYGRARSSVDGNHSSVLFFAGQGERSDVVHGDNVGGGDSGNHRFSLGIKGYRTHISAMWQGCKFVHLGEILKVGQTLLNLPLERSHKLAFIEPDDIRFALGKRIEVAVGHLVDAHFVVVHVS